MLRVFNSPINADANQSEQRELRDDHTSSLASQAVNINTTVVKEASQATACGFKVVKEASQRSLAATPDGDKREDEIYNGITLMTVCIVKDRVDILNKASGGRVLSVHNPILYRVHNSFPLAE